MFLVLAQDPAAPTGWKPVTLTAAETPEQAAAEGNTGSPCQIAVVPWEPQYFTAETRVEISSITETQMEERQVAIGTGGDLTRMGAKL